MKTLDEVPEAGESCPCCQDGIIEVTEFGEGDDRECFAVCEGLNGDPEDGCGWEEHYKQNTPAKPPAG
jgi:hypothetical protein